MSRALAACRWCGGPVAPTSDPLGRGRPPTWCSDSCRSDYRATFGSVHYDGPVEFAASCPADCPHVTASVTIPSPRAPGGWAAAYRLTVEATHGHPTTIVIRPDTPARAVS